MFRSQYKQYCLSKKRLLKLTACLAYRIRFILICETVNSDYIVVFCKPVSKNMENTSYGNSTYIFSYSVWSANIIISGILAVVSAYIVAALVYHESRIESKRDKFSRLSVEHKFALISKFLCILIAVMSLLRNMTQCIRLGVVGMYEELTENTSTAHAYRYELRCQVLAKLGTVLLTLGVAFVYLFLWFRQRIFYVHPSLKVLCNKYVKGISFSVIVVWLIYYTSAGMCYLIIVQYHFNNDCLIVQSTLNFYIYLIVSWGIVCIVMQIALLALFLYPIFKKTSWKTQKTSRNSDLMRRVKKAVALTSVCLISDVVFSAFTYAFYQPDNSSFFAPFSINLSINHLVTVGCFDNWQHLAWPWKLKPKHKNSNKPGQWSPNYRSPAECHQRE